MFAVRFSRLCVFPSCNSISSFILRQTKPVPVLSYANKYLMMSSNNSNKPVSKNKKNSSSASSQMISSRVQLSVIGNGANVNSISIAVYTDRETLLFNCGEGVQRLIFEHKVKISKIRHIFFTNVGPENFAGFFGFLLTIAPSVIEFGQRVQVYSPSRFESIAQIYDDFMYHARDINLAYKYVDIPDEKEEKLNGNDKVELEVKEKLLLDDIDFAVTSIPIRESAFSSNLAVAYILALKDRPGQLLVEKCKQLKVPPGPLFAKLKAGQEIEIEGRTIHPADVLGPVEVGPSFIILECPTQNHVKSLIQNGNFSTHLNGKKLEFIVHITPSDVFADERYQNWLVQFDPTTKHILLNRDNQSELSLVSSSIAQIKLNLIDGQIFKMLNESQLEQFQPDQHPVIRNSPTMFTYTLRPSKDLGITFNPDFCRLNASNIIHETMDHSDFVTQLEQFRTYVSKQITSPTAVTSNCSSPLFKPNVLFLGTGSATPGKQRNTSAILVNLQADKSMLFDCGEATFLQLNRFYGNDLCASILTSLKAIFISHYHADHHFGLIRIIQEHSKLSLKPLILIAPNCVGKFLYNFCNEVEDISAHYKLISCHELFFEKELSEELAEVKRKMLAELSLTELVTVDVPHCFDSHGIVITTADHEKIAYSGDTMFSGAFDQAARDCLLFIHEATMNDDLREEAAEKRHSTISDAIQAATNCNAKFTILTHFSQRYAKIAPVDTLMANNPLANYTENNVGIAFDFMNVELDQLWKVAKMKPLLETLFANDIQEMQVKRTKKALKRKLLNEAIREISS